MDHELKLLHHGRSRGRAWLKHVCKCHRKNKCIKDIQGRDLFEVTSSTHFRNINYKMIALLQKYRAGHPCLPNLPLIWSMFICSVTMSMPIPVLLNFGCRIWNCHNYRSRPKVKVWGYRNPFLGRKPPGNGRAFATNRTGHPWHSTFSYALFVSLQKMNLMQLFLISKIPSNCFYISKLYVDFVIPNERGSRESFLREGDYF